MPILIRGVWTEALRCERAAIGRFSEHTGRNASERRAGLEKHDAEANPPLIRGRLPATGDAHWGRRTNDRSPPPGYGRRQVCRTSAGPTLEALSVARTRQPGTREPPCLVSSPESRRVIGGANSPAGQCGDHAAASTVRARASGCQSRSSHSKAVSRVTRRRMTATPATVGDLP